MEPKDKKYLQLQFRDRVFSNHGTLFQSFFESVMERRYQDFQKIRPYGNLGDGGNDGYRKKAGVYYQVYAPDAPQIKESEAARKLKKDFERLKNEWSDISQINEYIFVFNEKYGGSVKPVEDALTNLEKDNPDIEFSSLLARELEELFFELSEDSILKLGFDIDSRKAISQIHKFLDSIEVELDRGCAINASMQLDSCEEIMDEIDTVEVIVRYQVLKGRVLNKLEKRKEAKDHFKKLIKQLPMEPSPLLSLAEIYIHENEDDKNEELIARARQLDAKNTLIVCHDLVRDIHLDVPIDLQEFNPDGFSNNYREKSVMYRLYAHLFETGDKPDDADMCIEQAIGANPDSLASHLAYLTLLESRLINNQRTPSAVSDAQLFLEEIEEVRKEFLKYGDIGPRNIAIINLMRIRGLLISESNLDFESLAIDTFRHVLLCNYDKQVDSILASLLTYFMYSDKALIDLFSYLENMPISKELSTCLVLRYGSSGLINNELKDFLQQNDNYGHFQLIQHLEAKEEGLVVEAIADDIELTSQLSTNKNISSGLRKKLIDSIPEDSSLQKDKLLLTLYYDDKKYKEAFDLLNQIDLANLSYHECDPILTILRENEAWDKEVDILEMLLTYEENPDEILHLKIQLLNAYAKLADYKKTSELGKYLLEAEDVEKSLKDRNVESLLHVTIQSMLERGKVYPEENAKALELHIEYVPEQTSWDYKLTSQVKVFISNKMYKEAYDTVIDAVKEKRLISPEQYASLYFLLSVEIGGQLQVDLDSHGSVSKESFVKFEGKERWYYLGEDDALDAIKITSDKTEYSVLLNAEHKNQVIFEDEYRSSKRREIIDLILSVDQYIFWKVIDSFHKLSNENALDGVQKIELRGDGENLDPKYLLKFLEDMEGEKPKFFDDYCNNRVPLAFLATVEGGLEQAIAKIRLEGRGFIHCNDGSSNNISEQVELAKYILTQDLPIFIDCTSALFLIESDFFPTVSKNLSNIKIPQSGITFLTDLAQKFGHSAGQVGYMGYSKGKITMSSLDDQQKEELNKRFLDGIKYFDEASENIINISSASKKDIDSENLLPANLTDAYSLAVKEGIPLLSEDYYYKILNEHETGSPGPGQISSIALARALYELGKIRFNEYLNYFGYLSTYRLKFLSINSLDMEKAALANSDAETDSYYNFRKLNISYTLSVEHGVSPHIAMGLIGKLVLRWIYDDSIPGVETELIFGEIVNSFPSELSNVEIGDMLLITSAQVFDKISTQMPEPKFAPEKIKHLKEYLESL